MVLDLIERETYDHNMTSKERYFKNVQKELQKLGAVRYFLMLIFSFFIGRVVILNAISPFGIALAAAFMPYFGGISVFVATTLGIISQGFNKVIIKYMFAMGFLLLYGKLIRNKVKMNRLRCATGAFISLLSASYAYHILFGIMLTYDVIVAVMEGTIAFIMVYVFSYVANFILGPSRRQILSGEEVISLSIFISLLIMGLWDMHIFGISIKGTLSILLVLIFAYVGGAGIGSAIGIIVGLVLCMTAGYDTLLLGCMGICGLIAGTFNELGRLGSSGAFVITNALITFYVNKSTHTLIPFVEIGIACFIMIIIPKSFMDYLKQFLDANFFRTMEQNYYIKRMQQITVSRLNEFSRVFDQMGKAFSKIVDTKLMIGKQDVSALFDVLAQDVCSRCQFYGECWNKNFYSTYSSMFELLTLAEQKNGDIVIDDIPKNLADICIYKRRLVEEIGKIYAAYSSNLRWQNKISECRQLVAQQLSGVSHVISELAADMDIDIRFKKELEDVLYVELDRNGIRAYDILVIEKSDGKMQVNITKQACNGRRECLRQVEKIVSRVMGRSMSNKSRECVYGGNGQCTLELLETQQFKITTGVARRTKDFKDACGDSYSFIDIDNGKYLLALSDGMGSGQRAALESSAVISLLENFLEVGFDLDLTIQTINSILLLRSQDEMFATADMCIIDLVEGNADFIKIGGVASFIKQNGEVETIQAPNLPIGILDQIEVSTQKRTLEDEDMIILMTDGVMDAINNCGYSEEWIKNIICTLDTKNPQEMADYIMDIALGQNGGQALDDMTVMVSRVWKPV